MKAGVCGYGGIESVSRCGGGDGGKACSDVIFDREKEPQVRNDIRRVSEEMAPLPQNGLRYRALLADRRAMETYLDVICAS